MVRKEQCPHCKGNKFVRVVTSDGHSKNQPCPHCSGNGFQIRVVLPTR